MKKISIFILLFISFLLVGCDWLTTSTTSSTTTIANTTTSNTALSTTTAQTTTQSTTQSTTTAITTTETTTVITTTEATTVVTVTVDPIVENLELINTILGEYDFLEHNGFDYSSIQDIGDYPANSDQISQRIDKEADIKIYTEYSISRLLEFDPDNILNEINTVDFYYQNQLGQYNELDQLVWSNISLEDYMEFSLPFSHLEFIYFEDFEFTYNDNYLTLNAYIKYSEIENFLGVDAIDMENCEITVTINLDNNSLKQIEIYYESTLSFTTILFVPYDEDAQVIIPNQ